MTKMLIALLCLNLIPNLLSAQTNDTIKQRPGQVSFFYPLGTNGLTSPRYSNNFSLNVLYGVNGGLNGVEFGGLVNVNTGNVTGIQFAGIANVTTQKINGIVFGGITNIIKDSSNSVAFGGISNVFGKEAVGLHFAGISNIVNGDLKGAQFGGISNVVNGNTFGVQFSGITNIVNGDFYGLQLAGISNVTNGAFVGSQIGLINQAKNIKGFQFGLINIADSYEKGIPFGLFSFIKDGYHAIEIAGNESIYGNLNFKMGVEQLYTIYKIGFTTFGGNNHITYGLGFGSLIDLTEKVKISIDLSANHTQLLNSTPRLNLLAKTDAALRYQFGNHFDIFAGPSVNLYLSDQSSEASVNEFKPPYTVFQSNWWNNQGSTSLWVGFNAGLSFRF